MAHMSEKVIWPITAPGVCAQSSMDCRLAPKRMSPNGLKPFIHSLFWNKWIRRKRPVRIPNTMYTCFTNMHMNIRYGEGSKDLCLQQQIKCCSQKILTLYINYKQTGLTCRDCFKHLTSKKDDCFLPLCKNETKISKTRVLSFRTVMSLGTRLCIGVNGR